LIDFLADKRIISGARSAELSALTQSDPRAAGILMKQAEQLGDSLRLAFAAMAGEADVKPEWVAPVNALLEITEGHDQLQREPGGWKLGFRARHQGLEWLLAAIARSGAELIAEGAKHRRRWCSMALCGNRSKVAAFTRRHGGEKARAHHA